MATTITAGNATNGAAVASDNTGILELKTGTGSGTVALTLNASQNATLAGTLGVGAVTSTGLVTGATGALYPIVSGTSQTAPFTAPNTSCDFTGIPPWVKRITVMFSGVSTNGTSNPLIQLGDAGGIENTSYASQSVVMLNASASVGAVYTAGFGVLSGVASNLVTGLFQICLVNGTTWVFGGWHTLGNATATTGSSAGNKSLSDVLTQVRITTVNGTDTFDAGTINILYE